MPNKPLVDIIVVNYNGRKLLKDCFKSLSNTNYPKSKFKIIMVDNCSIDGSCDFVKKNFPKVKIIKNDANNYCKANNLGIKASRAKYVALVNNDVKVDKNWLIELVKVMEDDPSVAACCSKALYPNGTMQNAGLIPLPNFYWEERGAGKKGKEYDYIEELDALNNASTLYRREYIEKVGYLDEDFVMFAEDIDISFRLKQQGFKLVFAPDSIVYHKFHGTATEELSRFYIERNRLLFIAKHYPHKLPDALLGNGYFTSREDLNNTGKIFSVVSQVLYKLLKHHKLEFIKEVINDIFVELQKISNYENKNLLEEILQAHNNYIKSQNILTLKSKEFEDYRLEKDNQLEEKYRELQNYKDELNNLSNQLKQRLDEALSKDGQLLEKDRHIENLGNRIEEVSSTLDGIYTSEGYRFVLKPLWWIIFNLRLSTKYMLSKIYSIILILINLLLTPIYIFILMGFLTEQFLWKILKPFMRSIAKERDIIPYEDLKISLVIPNWNGVEYLKKCLPSIFIMDGFKNQENEVLVVDDASSDGSAEYIEKNFPQVRLLRNNKNRKFGYTCNRGVKEAKNELIVLINNDIIVTDNFLEPLRRHFKDESVFAVSPKLYGWDKKTFKFGMHMGRFEDGYVRFWNESETKSGERIYKTSPSLIAIGGAMAFRKRDFLWLGGFDSIYRPNCWEDIDISYRAWKRGLKVLYEPESIMYHKDAATVSYERHKEIKNELLFTWKNIIDWRILKEHLILLPFHLMDGRVTFLKGFLWTLRFLPKTLMRRFKNRSYIKANDKMILDRCMKYYRNFERRNFTHLQKQDKRYILLVTSFMPYPLNNGGKIRMHTLAKLLKDRYNIILLTLINHENEERHIPELKTIFKDVYTVHSRSASRSLLSPYRYRYTHSEALIEKLKKIQKKYPIDLLQIESNELLYLTDHVKHLPVVYTEHDISLMSFINSYYRYSDFSFFRKFYDYLKKINYHNRYYKRIDKVISLSRKDIKIIRSFFPSKDIAYIPTGVDIDYFRYNYVGNTKKRIIFVGHYLHYPNEEAVVYFAKKIFPKIKRKLPEAEFLIVGSAPTDNVKKISSIDGIRSIGEVDNVKSYLYEASVFVNPIRTSAGIKGKVLEAMSCGIPVVSTTKGAWGLEAEPNKEILLADNPSKFAKKVLELLDDSKLHSEISINSRKLVEEKYDWNKITLDLDSVYRKIASKCDFMDIPEGKSIDIKKKDKAQPSCYPTNQSLQGKTTTKPQESTSLILEKVKNDVEMFIEDSLVDSPELGPEELHIELTNNCQSRCIMCDVWDYNKRANFKNKELDIEEIKEFINESSYLKRVKSIVLSGGEPFLRDDFVEICGFLVSSFPNACINILTNALDTDRIINKTKLVLDRYNPHKLWLSSSMDGLGNVHDQIRGYNGAFSKLTETLHRCKNELPEIKLSSTFTVTPYNTSQLLSVRNFCQEKDIDFFAQFTVQKDAREKFIWKEEHFKEVQKAVDQIIKELIVGRSYDEIKHKLDIMSHLYYWSHFVEYKKNPERFFKKCITGSRFAMFSPYGSLFFCPILRDKIPGNIREEKFDNIWMSEKAWQIRKYINEGKCHCCLVCAVFPLLNKVFELRREKEDRIMNLPTEETIYISSDERSQTKAEDKFIDAQLENSILNEREFKKGKIILDSFPQGIGIGAHFSCNAKCKFCQGGNYPNFNLGIYKNFIESKLKHVLPKAEYVNFCGYGELLLMPEIEKFFDYLNQTIPNKRKIITTNGAVLNERISELLADSKYSLQISLHASYAKLHEDITLTRSFDGIVKNIENLNNKGVDVVIKSTLTTLNIEDLPNLVRLAIKLGVYRLDCNYMTIYNNSHVNLSCFFQQDLTNRIFDEACEIASSLEISLNLPPRFSQRKYIENGRCAEPWKYFYVETQGSVPPCCYAREHAGYLNRDEFETIWNGKKYQNLRSNIVSNNRNAYCSFCYNNNANNVNDIRSHISFKPGIQENILYSPVITK